MTKHGHMEKAWNPPGHERQGCLKINGYIHLSLSLLLLFSLLLYRYKYRWYRYIDIYSHICRHIYVSYIISQVWNAYYRESGYIRIFLSNRTNKMWLSKGIYYKESTHAIRETGLSQSCSVGWQAADSGELTFQFQAEGQQDGNLGKVTIQMKSRSSLLEDSIFFRHCIFQIPRVEKSLWLKGPSKV